MFAHHLPQQRRITQDVSVDRKVTVGCVLGYADVRLARVQVHRLSARHDNGAEVLLERFQGIEEDPPRRNVTRIVRHHRRPAR